MPGRKTVAPAVSFVLILSLWELATRSIPVSPAILPGPAAVAGGLCGLASSGALLDHIVASLFRVSWGYGLAVAIAIPLGLVIGIAPRLRAFLNPVIQFLRPISPLAWIPMAILWFGIGDGSAVFLIFLSVVFPLTVFTASGVAGIRPTYLMVARNFDLKGIELISKVLLPAALPEIVVGLRITLGTAWLVIVAAEMIAVRSGLGYLILDARNSMRMDLAIGGMIVIGAIGLLLDTLVCRLDRLPGVVWSRFRA